MFSVVEIFSQSSIGVGGYWSPFHKDEYQFNSFEGDPTNLSLIKDWGLTISYGGEFSNTTNTSLYLISLSKTLGNNSFSFRYTPGFQKEFSFNNDVSIVVDTTTSQSLNSYFTYKELFGFGYSYRFSNNLSAGLTLRYFNQEFNQEKISTVIKVDSIYLERTNDVKDYNFWKLDFGVNYFFSKELSLSVSSLNLLKLGEGSIDPYLQDFELRTPKEFSLGLSYSPFSSFNLNTVYESNNSFLAGINGIANISGDNLGFSVSVFHDKYQSPYLAGIMPSISFSNGQIGISISSIKYFSKRKNSASYTGFQQNGIDNIINNRYSFDKVLLNVSLTLNTLNEQKAKILGIDVENQLYPTISDEYLSTPFATGTVCNLTDKEIVVKPFCKIEGINNEKVQSPEVKLGPNDTSEVKFYAFLPQGYSGKKIEISTVDFYVGTINGKPDDELQKPVLVNGVNAWDGKVSNLRYFITKDYDFSMKYAKNIISMHKDFFDTIPYALSNFYRAKFIFNSFIRNMVYASDPRASAGYVQFPHETMELKGGDCDDLSVLYSSLLESIGIQTALIDYKPKDGNIGHVNLMFNTELSPNQARLITDNDRKFFVRKNSNGKSQVWIVIETTSLNNFDTAWDLGSQKFDKDAIDNFGLAKSTVQIVNVY